MFGLFTGLLALIASAQAGAWETKTMQESFPAREVERSLQIGKMWFEATLATEAKLARGYWDSAGVAQDFDNDASFLTINPTLGMRYGLMKRVEINALVLVNVMRLNNPAYGTNTTGAYIGDPRIGLKYELVRIPQPLTSLVVHGEIKFPAGNESPGSQIAGPSTFREFINTTGTYDVMGGIAGKRQIGPIALDGQVNYVHRFSGIVQYIIETDQNQFAGRIKPSDQVVGAVGLTAQLGPIALVARPYLTWRFQKTAIGTTSGRKDGQPGFSIFPNEQLDPVVGSDGWAFDLETDAIVHINRNIDLNLGAEIPLRGEDLMFFPIEDLHPTRGIVWTGALELRY